MTLDEVFRIALEHFPTAHVMEDIDGEITIHTGLKWEAPLGYSGRGPSSIPAKYRDDVELREMAADEDTAQGE